MWYGGGGYGLGAHLQVAGAQPVSHARAFVELAKTGAASCRTCRGKIAKDSVRVQYGGGKFVHVRCWKGPDNQRVAAHQARDEDHGENDRQSPKENAADDAHMLETGYPINAHRTDPLTLF